MTTKTRQIILLLILLTVLTLGAISSPWLFGPRGAEARVEQPVVAGAPAFAIGQTSTYAALSAMSTNTKVIMTPLTPMMVYNTTVGLWVPEEFATAGYGVDASGHPAKISFSAGDRVATLEARGWVKTYDAGGTVTDTADSIRFHNPMDYNAYAYYKFTLASAPTKICLIIKARYVNLPIGSAGLNLSGFQFSITPKIQLLNLYESATKNRPVLWQYESGGGGTSIYAGTARTLPDAHNWYCVTSSSTATRLMRGDDTFNNLNTTAGYLQATTTEYSIRELQGGDLDVSEYHLLVL